MTAGAPGPAAADRRDVRADHPTLDRGQREALCAWLAKDGDGLTAATGYQSSLRVYRGPAGAFIVKEPSGRGLRRILSRAAIRHEARAYRRLQGVHGIPRCFGWLNGRYLVLEHIQGGTLHALESELQDRAAFFARLLDTLQMMHAAGVAHGDLKRKKNILVGPGEQPFVIDFGIAVLERDRQGFLFKLIRQADLNAWIKHKYRRRTSDIALEDAAVYKPMRLERITRLIRIAWQALTLRRWRKRRRESRG